MFNVQYASMLLHASPVWMRHVEPMRRSGCSAGSCYYIAVVVVDVKICWFEFTMIVNRYRFPSELGSGPTISTCMCPKRRVGCWKLPRDALVCLCILLRWQLTHVRVQVVMSFFIACQTNFSATSCIVARMDGWDN